MKKSARAKPEARLWRYLQKGLGGFVGVHLVRVENPLDPGTPDAFLTVRGRSIWLELKALSRVPKDTTLIKRLLRPAQVAWIARELAAGGHVYVILRAGRGGQAQTSVLATHQLPAFFFKQAVPYSTLISAAEVTWVGAVNFDHFSAFLGRRST